MKGSGTTPRLTKKSYAVVGSDDCTTVSSNGGCDADPEKDSELELDLLGDAEELLVLVAGGALRVLVEPRYSKLVATNDRVCEAVADPTSDREDVVVAGARLKLGGKTVEELCKKGEDAPLVVSEAVLVRVCV